MKLLKIIGGKLRAGRKVKGSGPTQNRTAVSSILIASSRMCLSHWTMGPWISDLLKIFKHSC
jgi:hypothetical protein